jgi:hypothetical protein
MEECEKGGLFKFCTKLATEEDKKLERARWREEKNETYTQGQRFRQQADQQIEVGREHKRELARARQQKHPKLMKDHEISKGERSPGVTKRKVRAIWIQNND